MTVVTGANGTFGYLTTPKQYTTYVATWNAVASGPIIAQVEPKITLRPGLHGYMKTQVTAGRSFWHRHVYLQRLSQFGQWVNVAALTLGPQSGKIFKPAAYLPKGVSHIRIFLSVNQAGIGLLSAHSGSQTLHPQAAAKHCAGRAREARPARRRLSERDVVEQEVRRVAG